MKQINAYLYFNGNCRAAMIFYKTCLGGELTLQTIGESPMADQVPPQMKDLILHAALTNGDMLFMGSDIVPLHLIAGNAVSLMLKCNSDESIRMAFDKLSEGGIIGNALEETFWGATFGDLTDKFGIHWLFNFNQV